jgi:CubicO group peptidase (beta-lactamase class C family)
MTMRKGILGLALVALAACGTTTSVRPLAVQTTPRAPAALDDPGPLFWSQAVRADRFARLEDFYAGLQVAAAPRTRALPQGAPLATSDTAAIERHLAEMGAVGIVVLQDGKLRHRWSRDGSDVRWTSFSVAKSFTSTLLGAAVKDGALALSDPVTKHLPALAGTAYDGVTVEQIATMTSGVKWNEDYTDPNSDVARMLTVAPVAGELQSVTYAKTLSREAPAGSKWVYKTLETNLLGDIVAAATRQSLAAYAKARIVDPAGFGGPLFWMVDRTGANIGGCCISIQLSDYARMGQWVLDGGQPSVPAGWFEQAGGKRVDIGGGNGYGYQWWSNPIGFGAQGIFGQYITIVPADRLVIAVVSNHPTATGKRLTDARNALWRKVAEAVKRQ